jgi:hypothetical protein
VRERLSRPFKIRERWTPTPVNNLFNATALCLNIACTQTTPITSPRQLLLPSGALGDFFRPGTTVGIPFAAQAGARVTF